MKLNAVITAAAPSQQHVLHQTLAAHDGRRPTMAQFLVEMLEGVAEQIALVIPRGESARFQPLVDETGHRVVLIEQQTAAGYANALYQAREFVDGKPFLHMVGDHFYIANEGPAQTLSQALVQVFEQQRCGVSAVQPTRETLLANFGAVAGPAVAGGGEVKLYQVETVLEKPTPTQAERELVAPGLRAGHYLCFFGMHLFTPGVMQILDELISAGQPVPSLSHVLQLVARRERYLAAILPGTRYDLGAKYGLLQAQLALALHGPDRADVLALLLEQAAR